MQRIAIHDRDVLQGRDTFYCNQATTENPDNMEVAGVFSFALVKL
jgi:hypothetical protein